MRQLQATDIFAFARVINAIGVKDEIKKITMKANKEENVDTSEVGFDILFSIIDKATQKNSEIKLFEFFAGLFEMEVSDVQKLDPCDFVDKIIECANVEKWKAFFTRVAKLIQSN